MPPTHQPYPRHDGGKRKRKRGRETYLLNVIHGVVLVVLAELNDLGQDVVLDVGQGDFLRVGAVVVCGWGGVGWVGWGGALGERGKGLVRPSRDASSVPSGSMVLTSSLILQTATSTLYLSPSWLTRCTTLPAPALSSSDIVAWVGLMGLSVGVGVGGDVRCARPFSPGMQGPSHPEKTQGGRAAPALHRGRPTASPRRPAVPRRPLRGGPGGPAPEGGKGGGCRHPVRGEGTRTEGQNLLRNAAGAHAQAQGHAGAGRVCEEGRRGGWWGRGGVEAGRGSGGGRTRKRRTKN